MPIGPNEVREQISEAEEVSIRTTEFKIDQELIRQRYVGTGTFAVELHENMTKGLRERIIKDYEKFWRTVRIVKPGYWWIIEIEGGE